MVASLLPTAAFASNDTFAIINGTPEGDKETNHGYITVKRETASASDIVTVQVFPNTGYQLKSLTYAPATRTTIAEILPPSFPKMENEDDDAPRNSWEATGTNVATETTWKKQCYLTYDGSNLRFKFVDDNKDIGTDGAVFLVDSNYVYIDNDITITFTMSEKEPPSIGFTGNEGNETWNGTYYPTSACVAAGTMVTMENGEQKAIEEIEIGDVIRTVDHETGTISSAQVCFLWESKNAANAFTLTFEDNTEVTVIEEHGFYELEGKKYVFINAKNAKDYIGHHFYNADSDSWLALKSFEMSQDYVDAYAIATRKHLNHLSNGMLSMCDGSFANIANIFEHDVPLKINADQKEKDITDNGGLTPLETVLKYKGFNEADYYDYNLQYLNVAIGKGLITWEWLEVLSDYCEANNIYDFMPESEPLKEEAPKKLLMSASPAKNMLSSTPTEIKPDKDGKYTFSMPEYDVIITAKFEKSSHTHGTGADAITFESWDGGTGHNSMPTEAGNYYLTSDITLTSTWEVPAGQSAETATTTNLCLNGHVIKLAKEATGSVIKVPQYATLNLYDCGMTKHYFTKNATTGLWTLAADQTIPTDSVVTGGVITGGNASGNNNKLKNGGGINVSGTFTMNGGNIVGNTASQYGSGVYVKDGSFTMYDGIVAGNTASQGGGVYADSTSVTLGGTVKIIENFRADNSADNFYVVGKNPIKPFSLGVGDNEPKAGMHVGIRMQRPSGGKFATNATDKTQVGCFTPDDKTFGVRLSSAKGIELAKFSAIITDGITNGTITTDATENKAFADDTVTITVTPSSGYQLKANTLKATYDENGEEEGGAQSCELAGTGNTYTFTMPAYAVTVSAEFERIPTPSSGGSSSSTITVPVSGDASTVKVSASVSGSTATVKPIKDVDLAKVTDGESVAIDLSGAGKNVDTAKIPTETVEKISEKSALTVKLPVATVEFDNTATAEIADQAKGSTIELVVDDIKEVSLNAVQKEAVKKLDTAVIIDAYLESNGTRLCTADNGGFGSGSAKVILPYEIKNNRTPENYSVYYVNETGKLQRLAAKYDEELKAFVFEIEHFSVYAVAYDEYAMPFEDIAETSFCYDSVKWAVANRITAGTDASHFEPKSLTTRAQMVTFLWRALGSPEPTSASCPFTDIVKDSSYYKAVLWAYENGITDGTSETTFEPVKNVSRAQAVTFLWRYAGNPVVNYYMNMSDIESNRYYTEAVRWALSEKITDGTTETTFSPDEDCLRGEIVTFLHRYFAE